MKNTLYRLGGLTLVSIIIFAGCSHQNVKVRGQIVASPHINPNIRGQSSPVVIKIFRLADVKRFKKASYYDLLKRPKFALGGDLLRVEPVIIRPGQSLPYKTDMDLNTKYIGVIGSFRRKKGNKWRSVHQVSIMRYENFVINIRGNTIVFEQSLKEVEKFKPIQPRPQISH